MKRIEAPIALLVLAALLLAGCGSTQTSPATASASSDVAATAEPGASGGASGEPTAAPESTPPDATSEPSPGESDLPVESAEPGESTEPEASPTPAAGAAGCTGTLDNRTFFEEIAGQVDWDLYCAVLPSRWHVNAGDFSLRDGGRMEITYRGPGDATLTLQEGNVCTAGASACSPKDTSLGSASFGDLDGGLVSLGPGQGFAIYVDAGSNPSWTAIGTGLDQQSFLQVAAALRKVTPTE
jgi:hypothetical protein